MSAYSDYFDRQSPSVELRRRLLTLPESGPRRRRTAPLAFAGAAAACCLLALGLLLRPGDEAAPDPALNQTPEPSAPQSGSEAKASRQFPEIQYGSGAGGVAADIALPDGHFQEDLTQEELADRAELSKGFISQLERMVGGVGVDLIRLRRLRRGGAALAGFPVRQRRNGRRVHPGFGARPTARCLCGNRFPGNQRHLGHGGLRRSGAL